MEGPFKCCKQEESATERGNGAGLQLRCYYYNYISCCCDVRFLIGAWSGKQQEEAATEGGNGTGRL